MSALHNNPFLLASGNPTDPTFPVQRSVRIRSSASAYFNRALASSGTTATFSAWVKRGTLGSASTIFGTTDGSTYDFQLTFTAANAIEFYSFRASAVQLDLITTQVFRDPSAWYHIVLVLNTTQATASSRVQIFVNGVQVTALSTATYPAQNAVTPLADSRTFGIGNRGNANNNYFDGYLTEINFIDGQALTPSSFGGYNSGTGVWEPRKYAGTYGTNGFYLNFQDNSGATATTIGKDSSGNGNNWTPNNISVTAGVTYDSMLDVPTLTSATNANYAVLNPLNNSGGVTISDGNLKALWASASDRSVLSTFPVPSTGKFYAEFVNGTLTSASVAVAFGLATEGSSRTGMAAANMWVYYASNQSFIVRSGTFSSQIGSNQTIAAGGIVQVAIDRANNQAWLGYNNVWINATNGTTGDPSAGTNPTVSSLPADLFIIVGLYADNGNVNFGQRPFSYTPPTGFVALNTYNLPAPTIPNGANQFAATTYTGTGVARSVANTVNGVSFAPDFVWIKDRTTAYSHVLFDTIRGAGNYLISNGTLAELTDTNYMSAFTSTGFSVGTSAVSNGNTEAYVGWQWKGGGTAVTNTSGSITSQVNANPSAGFSVVTYTGNGSAGATFGHGLGVAPRMVIIKDRTSGANEWQVYHAAIGNTGTLFLNTTNSTFTNIVYWNNTSPTSTTVTLGSGVRANTNTNNYVAYCFSEIAGYSKFGSYTGNGSTDGTFVYLGFRPRWIMFKQTNAAANWYIFDTSRNTYNVVQNTLYPNLSNAEATSASYYMDYLSNGFKQRNTFAEFNASGATYIYAAFAESPFNYSLAR